MFNITYMIYLLQVNLDASRFFLFSFSITRINLILMHSRTKTLNKPQLPSKEEIQRRRSKFNFQCDYKLIEYCNGK